MKISWLYQLIPNFISIFLILFSTSFQRPLEQMLAVDPYQCVNVQGDDAKDFAKMVALDWAARVGFHSAMLAAFASVIAATTAPFRLGLLIVAVMLLAIIWWWAQSHLWGEHFGDLHEGRFSIALRLDLVMILLNTGIALIIALSTHERRTDIVGWFDQVWPW